MFLSSYRNTSGSLGEQEILWEHEPTGDCFHNFLKFFQTSTSVSVTQKKTTSLLWSSKCELSLLAPPFYHVLENSPKKIPALIG